MAGRSARQYRKRPQDNESYGVTFTSARSGQERAPKGADDPRLTAVPPALLSILPDEIITHVLGSLDLTSEAEIAVLGRLCLVCRRLNRVVRYASSWAFLLRDLVHASGHPNCLSVTHLVKAAMQRDHHEWLSSASDFPPKLKGGVAWRTLYREALAQKATARAWKLRKRLLSLEAAEAGSMRELHAFEMKGKTVRQTIQRLESRSRGQLRLLSDMKELRSELSNVLHHVHVRIQPRLLLERTMLVGVRHGLAHEESLMALLQPERRHRQRTAENGKAASR